MKIALGIILILASLFLIVAVLMQSSKSHRLSGTIAGGAETFFGKKGKGAVSLRGKMIDAPIVTRAEQTIAMAIELGLGRSE